MESLKRFAPAAGWIGALSGAAWALARLGSVSWMRVDWADPWGWLGSADPEVALAAIARLVGLGIVAWLTLSTAAYVLARMIGIKRSRIGWLSLAPVRRAVDMVLAGSLVFNTMYPAAATTVEGPPPAVETTAPLSAVDSRYVPIPAGPAPTQADHGSGATGTPEPGDTDEGVDPTATTTVVVEPGDHLWKLSEERLGELLGRRPGQDETARYWVEVVAANRDVIRSGDPDLIFPGEEVVLPAPDESFIRGS